MSPFFFYTKIGARLHCLFSRGEHKIDYLPILDVWVCHTCRKKAEKA